MRLGSETCRHVRCRCWRHRGPEGERGAQPCRYIREVRISRTAPPHISVGGGQSKLSISSMALWRTVSVIGTANRDNDAHMDATLFDRMVTAVHETICATGRSPASVQLVSGGAAWADHVAVCLFSPERGYGYGSLRLCLPAPWDAEKSRFVDTAPASKGAPGARSNQLHAIFSRRLQRDSLVYPSPSPPMGPP